MYKIVIVYKYIVNVNIYNIIYLSLHNIANCNYLNIVFYPLTKNQYIIVVNNKICKLSKLLNHYHHLHA